ncbi:MAG: hypothetical protein ACKV2Q_28305 [Planctomycetaceae bacterium]
MSRLEHSEPIAAPQTVRRAVQRDYERFALSGLPASLEHYLLGEYALDMTAEYAGITLKNPWGKASGQLSMTARQVEEDVAAGLGFVVLKTVIAQDEHGDQSMAAWAIPEARMVTEPIVGQSGEHGWTITWKGRGWWQSFEAYLQLIRDARRIADGTGTLIVPSCKYHLPSPNELDWRRGEYEFTTRRLLEAWQPNGSPMPIEKDFSPTLAGCDRSAVQAKILEWLRVVPKLMRESAQPAERHGLDDLSRDCQGAVPIPNQPPLPHGRGSKFSQPLRVGLKMFNALFDDRFQVEMLDAIHDVGPDRPDFFVYANRLFDPQREFDGQRGVAFGGPDLSDRNLRVLDQWLPNRTGLSALPWSATGNITTGRMAVEYLCRGATSFQLHTFFQLPADQYAMKVGNRAQRALHELHFHPQTGFVVWLHHLANERGMSERAIRFLDLARR